MHPADVTSVLDFDAAIDDHDQAAGGGDVRAFLADHAELTPEALRADRDGVVRDAGHGVRRAKHVDDVDGARHVAQARVALLAQDLFLAGVYGYHAIAVAHQVETDEVACAQRVAR